jgi:hypothetical protein
MFEAALPLQAITIHEQQTTNNEPIKFSKTSSQLLAFG